jgi:hypothetical protein
MILHYHRLLSEIKEISLVGKLVINRQYNLDLLDISMRLTLV